MEMGENHERLDVGMCVAVSEDYVYRRNELILLSVLVLSWEVCMRYDMLEWMKIYEVMHIVVEPCIGADLEVM